MVISASDELDDDVAWNVDDFDVSKIGLPAAQFEQLVVGNHKSEDPVSRTTSKV